MLSCTETWLSWCKEDPVYNQGDSSENMFLIRILLREHLAADMEVLQWEFPLSEVYNSTQAMESPNWQWFLRYVAILLTYMVVLFVCLFLLKKVIVKYQNENI